MRRFYLSKEQVEGCFIDGDEYNHIKNVLRMRVGDKFIAVGETDGFDLVFEIVEMTKGSARLNLVEKKENLVNPKLNIMVVQALAKGDKLDLVTEKACELGATSVLPIYLKNCDVKEGSGKLQRLARISISATKQCGRSTPVEIKECANIKTLESHIKGFDLVILANEREDTMPLFDTLKSNANAKSIAIIIGPEGGFTEEEISTIVSYGAKSVSLGKRILRTETAGLYMLSVINEVFDN